MPSRDAGWVLLACLAACEPDLPQAPVVPPDRAAVFTHHRDPAFRLSADDRRALDPRIDADVLEELLARARPEHRAQVARELLELPPEARRDKVALGPIIIETGYPEIDSLALRLWRVRSPGR